MRRDIKMTKQYKYKVISNMPNFEPVYFHTLQEAQDKQDELLEMWSMINVYTLVIDLETGNMIS